MSTHTASNFDPQSYEIVDYLDSKQPQFFPMPGLACNTIEYQAGLNEYYERLERWRNEWKHYFGESYGSHLRRCEHCNRTGHVRYCAVVRHKPTGEMLTFGYQCAERCEFKDKASFRLKYILTHANKMMIHERRKRERNLWDLRHPDFIVALVKARCLDKKGEFVWDIYNRYAEGLDIPSDRQAESFVKAVNRECNWELERVRRKLEEDKLPKEPVPEGRIQITGLVLSTREQDTMFGLVTKCLVRDDRGFKVWGTCVADKGERVTFRATVERSKDDEYFGFYKRPYKPEVLD